MTNATQGRQADDHDEFWGEPAGVWWRWSKVDLGDGGPPVVRWMVRPPCGHSFMLAPAGNRNGPAHEVDEHDDGMITVQPKPNNSNSILCSSCGWHGYIDHGVWKST
jgi:hypothetical protein